MTEDRFDMLRGWRAPVFGSERHAYGTVSEGTGTDGGIALKRCAEDRVKPGTAECPPLDAGIEAFDDARVRRGGAGIGFHKPKEALFCFLIRLDV